jgi:hypothetical protein
MRLGFAISITIGIACAATSALASDTYPDAIKADLMAVSSPACDLCHNGGVGQKGNVNTPFGKEVIALGLVSGDDAGLKTVLDGLKAANEDADGDGTPDIDELVKGTNPNFNEVTGMAPGGADFPPPEYGCSVSARKSSSARGGLGAACLVALASLGAARRRRGRACGATRRQANGRSAGEGRS